MKTHIIKLSALLLSISLSSCECEPSVLLGEVYLTETSLDSFPYNGNETLIFINQDGEETKFYGENSIETKPRTITAKIICSNGVFDYSDEYYESEMETVTFLDQDGIQRFYADLKVGIDEPTFGTDDILFFDYLNIHSTNNNDFNFGQIFLIVDERGNQVDVDQQFFHDSYSKFIGDTILYEKSFEDIYQSTDDHKTSVFFNYSEGIVAYSITDSTYLVLDRIE
jgi:uncharacterized protein YrzB (UPF0473 family)